MSDQIFSLQPFTKQSTDLEVIGTVARRANVLTLSYSLLGDLSTIEIPAATSPDRQRHLWETTCFEFFLSMKNDQQYWEFNLSPAGHWNVYRFDEYRQGMKEETAFTAMPFSIQAEPDALSLALKLNLSSMVSATQILEMAIATVVKHKDGTLPYWALKHPSKEPDFHRREAFMIQLP
jgi:hypothetical protein